MREIKFRAWDKDNGVMLSPWDTKRFKLVDMWGEEHFKFLQYTGLKDKNGVDGYHKDIVQLGPFLFTIECDVAAAKFYLKSTNDLDRMKYTMTHFTKGGIIVGNSFENPELLKEAA